MNRLEKFSVSFMTKKMSNTTIPERSRLGSHSKLNGTKHTEPEPKYDWRARHDERKKQREQERASKTQDASESSSQREKPHRVRGVHFDQNNSGRVGRMHIGNCEHIDHNDNTSHRQQERLGRMNLPHSQHTKDNGHSHDHPERPQRKANPDVMGTTRDRDFSSPSRSPRTQRRNRNAEVESVAARPTTRAGRLAALSGRGI